jgi:hypothetical protein
MARRGICNGLESAGHGLANEALGIESCFCAGRMDGWMGWELKNPATGCVAGFV